MKVLLREDFPAFEAALRGAPPVSIRLNPFKNAPAAAANPASEIPNPTSKIPWHPLGFYLSERPVFTLDPRFHAGAYYVQEASSMFLHEALRQSVDFSKPLKVLDLCAAPGGKSTLLASMVSPESLLVANEVVRPRTGPLRENLEKWGCPNVAVTSGEAEQFAAMQDWFDVIVADAPCSGEGLFRKDPDAGREWSAGQVEVCAVRQQKILAAAVAALAPGGVLAYSTCTFSRLENEANAARLLAEHDLEPIFLDLPETWGIETARDDAGQAVGHRFFPHRLRGEGFFMALFRKKPGAAKKAVLPSVFQHLKPLDKKLLPEMAVWMHEAARFRFFQTPAGDTLALPAALESDFLFLDKHLKTKWFGTTVGTFKGRDFIPDHALALSQNFPRGIPRVELERLAALRFLKKEVFEMPAEAADLRGWALVCFEGLNLGWAKLLPGRVNNYLPMNRRIRMEIAAH